MMWSSILLAHLILLFVFITVTITETILLLFAKKSLCDLLTQKVFPCIKKTPPPYRRILSEFSNLLYLPVMSAFKIIFIISRFYERGKEND